MFKGRFFRSFAGPRRWSLKSLGWMLVALTLAGSVAPAAAADAPPQRIASFNLCADQLVTALADPAQIVALSPYARDANLSAVASAAAQFPSLDWNAESVVKLAPDLVFIGPSARPLSAMMQAMHIRTVDIGLVSTIAQAQAQARTVGEMLGHPVRGAALAEALGAAQARLRQHARDRHATGLMIERRGYAAGPESLAADMLAAAGLVPPAGAPSGYGGFVSLEQLLVLKPEVLVLKDAPDIAVDQSALFLTHPALRARFAPRQIVPLPARYTLCGGPALLEGLRYLETALAEPQLPAANK